MTPRPEALSSDPGVERVAAEYVLPLRWNDDTRLDEMTAYLRELAGWVDVTLVDGSDPHLFAAHQRAWSHLIRHVPPPVSAGGNGKVRGVLTGLAIARYETVIIADDDVRHTVTTLHQLIGELDDDADLVRPQNVFRPRPWHARWDTARSLMNRALGHDYPGTYAVRRSALPDGYDAHVLFENLEMERTVRARGGRLKDCPAIFIERRPPTARQFWAQRVRQAYDSLAQPSRHVIELSIVPLVFALRRRPAALVCVLVGAVLMAEVGRRRGQGRRAFPAGSALWAPVWVAERAVTSWIAAALRVRGGVRYAGTRILRPATPFRVLRRRVGRLREDGDRSAPPTRPWC
ncbi:hypothetical protein J2X55_001664 [Microbacterium sp. 1154]|uniref:glycosyltransferase n=1 Tax=Microbacterium sp. 1154 TaxID=2817733 RepID=UPI00286656E5|nr:glycosyltransferase [Microbacterium sp. 1154]MDR6690765.1 hypothetical protein [Microbacterium sp. 1154]